MVEKVVTYAHNDGRTRRYRGVGISDAAAMWDALKGAERGCAERGERFNRSRIDLPSIYHQPGLYAHEDSR